MSLVLLLSHPPILRRNRTVHSAVYLTEDLVSRKQLPVHFISSHDHLADVFPKGPSHIAFSDTLIKARGTN